MVMNSITTPIALGEVDKVNTLAEITEWKRLFPVVKRLEELGYISVATLHDRVNQRLRDVGHGTKTENSVYRWVKQGVTPRPEKNSTVDIVGIVAETVVDVANDHKPEHNEHVKQAIDEQDLSHLRVIEGEGMPLPRACMVVSPGLKRYEDNFVLYRVGLAENNKAWELKQVPFRILLERNVAIYEEYFEVNGENVGGSGFAYLLGNALTIFFYNEVEIYGEVTPSLFCGSFNVRKQSREWVGPGGIAGMFVATDDLNSEPGAHKAVMVRANKGISWLPVTDSWDEFKKGAQATYPLKITPDGVDLAHPEKHETKCCGALKDYIKYLNFNSKERKNAFLYASYGVSG